MEDDDDVVCLSDSESKSSVTRKRRNVEGLLRNGRRNPKEPRQEAFSPNTFYHRTDQSSQYKINHSSLNVQHHSASITPRNSSTMQGYKYSRYDPEPVHYNRSYPSSSTMGGYAKYQVKPGSVPTYVSHHTFPNSASFAQSNEASRNSQGVHLPGNWSNGRGAPMKNYFQNPNLNPHLLAYHIHTPNGNSGRGIIPSKCKAHSRSPSLLDGPKLSDGINQYHESSQVQTSPKNLWQRPKGISSSSIQNGFVKNPLFNRMLQPQQPTSPDTTDDDDDVLEILATNSRKEDIVKPDQVFEEVEAIQQPSGSEIIINEVFEVVSPGSLEQEKAPVFMANGDDEEDTAISEEKKLAGVDDSVLETSMSSQKEVVDEPEISDNNVLDVSKSSQKDLVDEREKGDNNVLDVVDEREDIDDKAVSDDVEMINQKEFDQQQESLESTKDVVPSEASTDTSNNAKNNQIKREEEPDPMDGQVLDHFDITEMNRNEEDELPKISISTTIFESDNDADASDTESAIPSSTVTNGVTHREKSAPKDHEIFKTPPCQETDTHMRHDHFESNSLTHANNTVSSNENDDRRHSPMLPTSGSESICADGSPASLNSEQHHNLESVPPKVIRFDEGEMNAPSSPHSPLLPQNMPPERDVQEDDLPSELVDQGNVDARQQEILVPPSPPRPPADDVDTGAADISCASPVDVIVNETEQQHETDETQGITAKENSAPKNVNPCNLADKNMPVNVPNVPNINEQNSSQLSTTHPFGSLPPLANFSAGLINTSFPAAEVQRPEVERPSVYQRILQKLELKRQLRNMKYRM